MTETDFLKLHCVGFGDNRNQYYAYSENKKYLYVLTPDVNSQFPVWLNYKPGPASHIYVLKNKAIKIYAYLNLGPKVESVKPKKEVDDWGFEK